MPDPFLALADLSSPAPFKLAAATGKVFPQFLEAGSTSQHTRFFYVEYPANDTGSFYQIDAARLVAVVGDGGSRRHFKAHDVASILSRLSPSLDHAKFLTAVSLSTH